MENQLEPEKLTIGQLFKSMKLSHLWGLIGVIAIIIASSYKAGQWVNRLDIEENQMSKEKEVFLEQSLRYELSKRLVEEGDIEQEELNEMVDQFELSQKMYADLIARWWKNQNDLEGGQIQLKRIIRKGWNPKDSEITFADGTTWPIPPEIKALVLENE